MRIYGEKNWGRKTLPQGNPYASRGVSHYLIGNKLSKWIVCYRCWWGCETSQV